MTPSTTYDFLLPDNFMKNGERDTVYSRGTSSAEHRGNTFGWWMLGLHAGVLGILFDPLCA